MSLPAAPATRARRALGPTEVVTALSRLQGWTLDGEGPLLCICKTFAFDDYARVLLFVQAVAYGAQQRDHHPELRVHPRHCEVRWRTHDVQGLSALDFEGAAQVDALYAVHPT